MEINDIISFVTNLRKNKDYKKDKNYLKLFKIFDISLNEFYKKEKDILRDRIKNKKSIAYISAMYGVSPSTVYRIIDKLYLKMYIKSKNISFK